ncbi:MAG: cytochrome c oxidase subunit 3, partial [Planctomycetota bacterium]
DHPEWLAHHFDTPEQQFDSGKLGIWLFLVTEVLFFSGMFCAYAIFRMLRPEVFEGCSQFLNTKLGAINTGVLLFSSLTMAWAVRCSQTEEHKKLVALIATTLSCAMIFLGVKSIEYSHKWDLGLLPPGSFSYVADAPHHHEGVSMYLIYLCLPFAILTVGTLIWLAISKVLGKSFQYECAKPLSVVCLSFFLGVGLGTILESGEAPGTDHGGDHALVEHDADHHESEHDDAEHHGDDHDLEAVASKTTSEVETPKMPTDDQTVVDQMAQSTGGGESNRASSVALDTDLAGVEVLAESELNTGARDLLAASASQSKLAAGRVTTDPAQSDLGIERAEVDNVMTPRQAGVFFGIYYCMTGIHAIHILAGIGVLVWLLVRAIREDFNRQYFGPVDYVGLYWHLVDLIWIYLFPLLYLIR